MSTNDKYGWLKERINEKKKLNDQNGQCAFTIRIQLCGLAYTVGILIGKNLLRNYLHSHRSFCLFICFSQTDRKKKREKKENFINSQQNNLINESIPLIEYHLKKKLLHGIRSNHSGPLLNIHR